MHVVSCPSNTSLYWYAGIELQAISSRVYVLVKATIDIEIMSGSSILAADWTICLENVKTGSLS
jgi:hypothetical protein